MDGGMLLEKAWEGEPSLEEMGAHMMVGDAATVAARMAAEIRAAAPCHYLLQVQVGDMDPPERTPQELDQLCARAEEEWQRLWPRAGNPALPVPGRPGVDPRVIAGWGAPSQP